MYIRGQRWRGGHGGNPDGLPEAGRNSNSDWNGTLDWMVYQKNGTVLWYVTEGRAAGRDKECINRWRGVESGWRRRQAKEDDEEEVLGGSGANEQSVEGEEDDRGDGKGRGEVGRASSATAAPSDLALGGRDLRRCDRVGGRWSSRARLRLL